MWASAAPIPRLSWAPPFFSYPRIVGLELGVEVVEVVRMSVAFRLATVARGTLFELRPLHRLPAWQGQLLYDLKVLGVHIDGGMQEFIKVR